MQRQGAVSTEPDDHMEDVGVIRVLAISGSVRHASSNGALVKAAAQLAPPGVEVAIYEELDQLPPFNPDLDSDAPPMPVGASEPPSNRRMPSCSPALNTRMAFPAS